MSKKIDAIFVHQYDEYCKEMHILKSMTKAGYNKILNNSKRDIVVKKCVRSTN